MLCTGKSPEDNKLTRKIVNFLSSRKNELTVNISRLDFIDATRTALLNSTECYVINPVKKINWIVKNEAVRSVIMPFKLENMEILTLQEEK